MTFDLDHWRNPRKAIATKYERDDLGYATHGACMAMQVIRELDLRPSEAAQRSILDYGCGTGRVSRVLAGYFGEVVGFDPVVECIQTGVEENRGMPFRNLILTSMFSAVEGSKFDFICSVNVMEHLGGLDQRIMLSRIQRMAKPGASLVLWYSMRRNRNSLIDFFGPAFTVSDDIHMEKSPDSDIMVRAFGFQG